MFKLKPKRNEYFIKDVCAGPSGLHGVGCFATADIPAHTCIERSPCVTFDNQLFIDFARDYDTNHILYHYAFRTDNGTTSLPWGYACLYNHSPHNNATWKWSPADTEFGTAIEIWTIKDVKKGEEICTKYYPHSHALSFLDSREEERLGIQRTKFDE